MKTYWHNPMKILQFLSLTWESSKNCNIILKYFRIFNNKPPGNWVVHITRYFITCYFCLYYSFMLLLGSPWNEISLQVLKQLLNPICIAPPPSISKIWKKTEDEPMYCPDRFCKQAFANYQDHTKNLVVFKRWCICSILCEYDSPLKMMKNAFYFI